MHLFALPLPHQHASLSRADHAPVDLLQRGQILTRSLRPGQKIDVSVCTGTVWLTLGDGQDHILRPGRHHVFTSGTGRRRVVLQALLPSQIQLAQG